MHSATTSALPSSPQSSGAILPDDVQQRSPRATWAHVQRQCDMGPAPYHTVSMTVVTNHPESRVENSALIQSSSPRLHRLHPLQPAQPEGTVPSPLSAISPDQYNFQINNSQHGRRLPLNSVPPTQISETSSGYPGAAQSRPRTYNQVFHSTSDLAAHHGIPQSLPPPPRTTPQRSSEPEQIPDFQLSTLCSNYLTMLASNKSAEQTDFLTSPHAALDADAGMMPDIYTSPIMGMGFGGDDFDNMPSLFGSSAYDGYDVKETMDSHLSPSDLPLPDMDDMYKISPEMPVLDDVSMQASPLHEDDSSAFPTRRKSAPTGTRKNITPEALSRKYRLPSSTSRKELPATFARKRARTSVPPADEPEDAEDAIRAKRLQNTLAARRSRKRKLEYQRELEDAIDAERKDKEMWRAHALVLEALLRDKGHEVPRMIDA
ncbi:hypothetical protein BJV77DRAFT_1028324 [Russula vinacea]|nr:hypothetical protein BJV77DRAFT_1028324 [Russula vinacea]